MCKYGSKYGIYRLCYRFALVQTHFCIISALCKFDANPFFRPVPVSGNHPCKQPPTGTITLKEFCGSTKVPNSVLTLASLRQWVGEAGHQICKSGNKAMIHYDQQASNCKHGEKHLHTSSWQGQPLWPPRRSCRFVKKTTGCVHLRLT